MNPERLSADPDAYIRFSASPPAKRAVARAILSEVLCRLPTRHADVLIAYYIGGLTQRELGVAVGVSQAAVSGRLAIARYSARLVAHHLAAWPHPSLMVSTLRAEGESEAVAAIVAGYLRTWQTTTIHHPTTGDLIPQSTAWEALTGLITRRGQGQGIARIVLAIRTMPGRAAIRRLEKR